MVEWAYLILCPLGAFLWALGGTGWKNARRFLYPFCLLVAAYWLGWGPGYPALLALVTSIANCLGYGDSHSWFWRIFVGNCYGLSAGILMGWPGLLIPVIAMPIIFCGLMLLSRRSNSVHWKIVELVTGFSHALFVTWSLTQGR